jgi:hypothetical protein
MTCNPDLHSVSTLRNRDLLVSRNVQLRKLDPQGASGSAPSIYQQWATFLVLSQREGRKWQSKIPIKCQSNRGNTTAQSRSFLES